MEHFQQDPCTICAWDLIKPGKKTDLVNNLGHIHKLFQRQMYKAQKKIVSIATSCGIYYHVQYIILSKLISKCFCDKIRDSNTFIFRSRKHILHKILLASLEMNFYKYLLFQIRYGMFSDCTNVLLFNHVIQYWPKVMSEGDIWFLMTLYKFV